MAPKPKASTESLKQQSLKSFFGGTKKDAPKPSTRPPKQPDASSSSQPPSTPPSNIRTHVKSSSVSSLSSAVDTPPTSDVIDVDMSDEEMQRQPVRKAKRKISAYASDEDAAVSSSAVKGGSRSLPPSSSPIARTKKRKLSAPVDEEDDEEAAYSSEVSSAFSETLTKFKKKSPVKKARKSASDDEDFQAPSDDSEDDDTKSIKSSSSRSSKMTILSDDEDDDIPKAKSKSRPSQKSRARRALATGDDGTEDDEEPRPKKKTAAKASAGKAAGGTSGGSNSFLTAAEQREQAKKDDKKAAEDPYAFLQDVKDKDGRRPGDPLYDPRTLYVPKSAWSEFTPFEKQFWEIKQNHYDTILFFQKGKFFELYEDDARIGHQQFDLKLTNRVKMSMVGVPEMSFQFWAAKFLGKGYKVGRVDQSETALGAEMRVASDKGKGKVVQNKEKEKIVRRELHKVFTNGTLIDGEMLTEDEAGHCISIREEESDEGNKFGICVLDCATSQFNLSVFEDDICRTKLETLMRQVRPKEILFTKGKLSVSTTRLLKSVLPAACLWTGLREVEGFGYEQTIQELRKLYPSGDEDENMDEDSNVLSVNVPEAIRDMADSKNAMESLGIMIWYLRQLNIDKDILSMKNFNVYDPMKRGLGMVLDGQSLAHLEVLLNNDGTEEGTLLKLLNRCVTPSGKRLFRIWICMPLREISDINARLDAVEDLMDHPTFESDFMQMVKGLPDLERIVSRVHANSCKIKDFLKLLAAFKKLSRGLNTLASVTESFKSKTLLGLLRSCPDLLPYIKNVESMFEKPDSAEKEKGEKDVTELVPCDGKDEEYDEVKGRIDELESELESEKKKFEKKLGIKLGWWHSHTGNKEIYLIETDAKEKNIPKDWTKNSGTKAKSRWIVPSMQGKVRALKEERENRSTTVKSFRGRVYGEFDKDRSVWLRAVRVLAELDCLLGLAKSSNAIGTPSCRPVFVEGEEAWVDFQQLRHPTLALSASVSEFIPNDVKLGGGVGRIALLTGPNMAGKSTAMRMTATGVIMAQLGMYVPAEGAKLCPVDGIQTRMGAYDNMFMNSSTFKVELDECCKVLRDATPKSLVIMDELGRGTSTYDGMAIAGAVLHELATHTLPLAFFATHYSSLTDDFSYHPNIRTMHMSTLVDDEKRDIVFLFKLIEGVATSSFGTHVANLAGVPLSVVERADTISKTFAAQFQERMKNKKNRDVTERLPLVAQADFVYLFKLATGLVRPEDQRGRLALSILKETVKKRAVKV